MRAAVASAEKRLTPQQEKKLLSIFKKNTGKKSSIMSHTDFKALTASKTGAFKDFCVQLGVADHHFDGEAFNTADTNNDSGLSWDEFLQYFNAGLNRRIVEKAAMKGRLARGSCVGSRGTKLGGAALKVKLKKEAPAVAPKKTETKITPRGKLGSNEQRGTLSIVKPPLVLCKGLKVLAKRNGEMKQGKVCDKNKKNKKNRMNKKKPPYWDVYTYMFLSKYTRTFVQCYL
jgi:hypothetical protein